MYGLSTVTQVYQILIKIWGLFPLFKLIVDNHYLKTIKFVI